MLLMSNSNELRVNVLECLEKYTLSVKDLQIPQAIWLESFMEWSYKKIRMLDGQTFAIGGLIAEADQMVDDKVPIFGDLPVMGRFFRSEVSQKVKNNLVVFTTVRIIKPDGTLQYPESDENPEYQQGGSGELMSAVP